MRKKGAHGEPLANPKMAPTASNGKLDRGTKTAQNRSSGKTKTREGPAMPQEDAILVGKGEAAQLLQLGFANRHGLIAGATGTGKTVSLQILAEGFSSAGVPVFMADVKGDLSGISQAASANPKLRERAAAVGLTQYTERGFPTVFWDLFGAQGHPMRTTVSEMGPLLLARLLGLNDTQEGVLTLAFRVADDQGLLLLDLKDLRALMNFVGEQAQDLSLEYGRVSTASVGAIQRRLLTLEQQGGEHFFGEPALDIKDLMRTDLSGQGIVNVLAADQLMLAPKLYATFLLWLLSELFEALPEVGDPPKPGLVFFFDEAHLLFDEAPKVLLDKVEQVVRLVRSKGVGVYFVSQSPLDIPQDVLGQLGNRIQHALRAFTPLDQKAVRTAAQTFRANPAFDAAEAITQLGVGEALVSTLQAKGIPGMVDRTLIRPPSSRIGPATPDERQLVIGRSPFGGRYDQAIDRDSAFEVLKRKAEERVTQAQAEQTRAARDKAAAEAARPTRGGYQRQTVVEAVVKSVARSVGSQLGRQIVRGLLGSILRR
jgi:DNA helicase HerA-like ATPase